MKRFLSVLLVAILIVTSLATVAFAAGTATVSGNTKHAMAGEEVTLTFTVSGEFANYELVLSTSSPLTITNISGIVNNINTGKVAWANDENVASHSFTVTVKVAEDAQPGTYYVNAEVLFVSDRNLEIQSTSVNAGAVVVDAPACVHDYKLIDSKEATCTEEGFKTYECSKCGHTYTEILPKVDHVLADGWKYNGFKHWHICSVCGEEFDHADHGDWQYIIVKEATKEEDGLQEVHCGVCDYYFNEVIDKDKDPVPPTGDITPVIALGVTSLITLAGTSLYVFKRRNAK